jgi:phage tail sheath protein FI
VYARSERERGTYGVVWPPANLPVHGATDIEVDPTWEEAGELSEGRINPLIIQAGRGIVVWGARTLSADDNFQAVNSRRVVSMVTEQLRRDNEWAVFEQNDAKVWAVLERNARVRLEEFWRAGLITSEARKGDFLVQCDRETNPPVERDAGTLNVRVQLRPIGMTEHITIDLRLGESGAKE